MNRSIKIISTLLIIGFVAQDLVQAQGGTPLWNNVLKSRGEATPRPYDENSKLNTIAIPNDSGLIRKVAVSAIGGSASGGKGTDEIIINIQDAHSKLGAQESITKILDNLVKNYNLKLIALEGSSDLIDTSLVSSFPIAEVKKKTGEYLLKEGKISAGEFYSMISESPVSLYGVEDPALYKENVEVFKDLINKKLDIRKELKNLKATIHELETKVYSQALQELVSKRLLHKQGDLKFTEYWDYFSQLAKARKVDYTQYSNLKKLADTVELEKEIDFKKAGEERDTLIRELGQKLPKVDLERLVLAALQFKQSKLTPGAFHYTLSQLSQGVDINPLNYKNIILYSEYVVLYESIDLISIFDEVELFENALKETLYRTNDERTLSNLTHCANILSQLLDASLNSKDYEFFVKNEASCEIDSIEQTLNRLIQSAQTPPSPLLKIRGGKIPSSTSLVKEGLGEFRQETVNFDVLKSAIPSAKRFYELASKRNEILLQNTLKRMRQEKTHIAALITGGFHTEGISKLMDDEKLSYLVVMPKFDDKSPDRPYIAILTQKPKEYEEQFKDTEFYVAPSSGLTGKTITPDFINEIAVANVIGSRLAGLGSSIPLGVIENYAASLKHEYEVEGADAALPKDLTSFIAGFREASVQPIDRGARLAVRYEGKSYVAVLTDDHTGIDSIELSREAVARTVRSRITEEIPAFARTTPPVSVAPEVVSRVNVEPDLDKLAQLIEARVKRGEIGEGARLGAVIKLMAEKLDLSKMSTDRLQMMVTERLAKLEPKPAGARLATVLVVDDEKIIRTLVAEVLEQEGYQVIQASDGQEALNLIMDETNPLRPDLILSDGQMPGMGGKEFLQSLKAHQIHIPFIFISGYSFDQAEITRLSESGKYPVSTLAKPFQFANLRDLAAQMLETGSKKSDEIATVAEKKTWAGYYRAAEKVYQETFIDETIKKATGLLEKLALEITPGETSRVYAEIIKEYRRESGKGAYEAYIHPFALLSEPDKFFELFNNKLNPLVLSLSANLDIEGLREQIKQLIVLHRLLEEYIAAGKPIVTLTVAQPAQTSVAPSAEELKAPPREERTGARLAQEPAKVPATPVGSLISAKAIFPTVIIGILTTAQKGKFGAVEAKINAALSRFEGRFKVQTVSDSAKSAGEMDTKAFLDTANVKDDRIFIDVDLSEEANQRRAMADVISIFQEQQVRLEKVLKAEETVYKFLADALNDRTVLETFSKEGIKETLKLLKVEELRVLLYSISLNTPAPETVIESKGGFFSILSGGVFTSAGLSVAVKPGVIQAAAPTGEDLADLIKKAFLAPKNEGVSSIKEALAKVISDLGSSADQKQAMFAKSAERILNVVFQEYQKLSEGQNRLFARGEIIPPIELRKSVLVYAEAGSKYESANALEVATIQSEINAQVAQGYPKPNLQQIRVIPVNEKEIQKKTDNQLRKEYVEKYPEMEKFGASIIFVPDNLKTLQAIQGHVNAKSRYHSLVGDQFIVVDEGRALTMGEPTKENGQVALLMQLDSEARSSRGALIVATKILIKFGEEFNIPGLRLENGVFIYLPIIEAIELFKLLKSENDRLRAIGSAA